MNTQLRILTADDSAVIRRLLTDTLNSDPHLTVAHAAKDGREAVECFPTVRPDVVLLDVEMPVMDGVEAVAAIRRIDRDVPIVMFSSITTAGGQATLDALSLGASHYVTKPSQSRSPAQAVQHVRQTLIPQIRFLGHQFVAQRRGRAVNPPVQRTMATPPVRQRNSTSPVEVVAVGVSTGGPTALTTLLRELPRDFPVPIVIVQHMPPVFTELLAERLNTITPLHVSEAREDVVVEPGHVWLAPGGKHTTVRRTGTHHVLRLDEHEPENSCRPSVDVLFRSVADSYADRSLAVVMTGMGADGVRGARRVRERGGRVFAQDQATSTVWGMPGEVVKAGLAEQVVPLDSLASTLTRTVSENRRAPVSV